MELNQQTLLDMLTDPDWKLEDSERSPVLATLAYLCDPEDVIPDEIPGIGLLDDAVMIELVFRELRHELEVVGERVGLGEAEEHRHAHDGHEEDSCSYDAHGTRLRSSSTSWRLGTPV